METFSMNVIAHTLSQHSEMIAPGVMGINFMKPEKPINTMSEVYKLVQEQEQCKASSPTPGSCPTTPLFRPTKIPPNVSPKPAAPMTNAPAPSAPAPAPVLKPVAPKPVAPEGPSHGPCTNCGRNILGHFVSLSDRILHEECFICSTCGSSLKNTGFHNINNKLYCDTHAKLAARVITSNIAPPVAAPAPAYVPPAPAPIVPPIPAAVPSCTPLAPQPPTVPSFLPSSVPQTVPTPYCPNMTNLPKTPSSSGGLAFRSVSPQPFKRISGEFHRVNAPTSPTPGSGPSAPLAYSSGPLPFEMKPYMPPDQTQSSVFSSMESSQTSEIQQMTQTSQTIQRSTQVTQQFSQSSQSQCAMDYKQLVSGQSKTKFVWPPPKFEIDGLPSTAPPSSSCPSQNYSPLVTQSTPQDSQPGFRSVQPPVPAVHQEEVQQEAPPEAPAPPPPSCFYVPPLPATFSAEPAKVEDAPMPEPKPEEASAQVPPPPPAPLPATNFGAQAPNFAPVLPPVADLKPTSAPQPGVPTGAGSKPAPKKGRGQLMKETTPGRIPICGDCGDPIRGPFIIALNRTWCPDHFHCNNLHCKTQLIEIGFVEEQGQLYCENCYEAFLAPICNKCNVRIKGDCLNALDKQWHPECFICAYCSKPFGNNSFYLEDGLPYCEKDWNELFTTKCISCGFPIEAGDRWVEALNNNYHSQCFKCSICQKNLEGQSFYAKGGKPYCKQHAR